LTSRLLLTIHKTSSDNHFTYTLVYLLDELPSPGSTTYVTDVDRYNDTTFTGLVNRQSTCLHGQPIQGRNGQQKPQSSVREQ